MQAPVPPLTGKESYTGPAVDSVEFRTGDANAPVDFTLAWLPGAQQRADNEILRRMVNAFHDAGLNLRIVGLAGEALLPGLLSRTPPGMRILLGGHSMGGGAAARFCSSKRASVSALITINAALPARGANGGASAKVAVPAMFIVGQNDPGATRLKPKFPSAAAMTMTLREGEASEILVARNGDHSLRFNGSSTDESKVLSATSSETAEMNQAVAREVRAFLQRWCPVAAPQLPAPPEPPEPPGGSAAAVTEDARA